MLQKVIQVGNSAAITIPQSFLKKAGWKVGDEVVVDSDDAEKVLFVKESGSSFNTKLTPEFKDWLSKFTTENKKLLAKLAK